MPAWCCPLIPFMRWEMRIVSCAGKIDAVLVIEELSLKVRL
jgi:hypothetical protein